MFERRLLTPPPPPCPAPPLVFPQGWVGGPSLGQHKNFCYGSLFWCVGDCVVRHCLLYPLYSWHSAPAKPPAKCAAQSIPGKVVSMCRSPRSSGAGPRNFTPRRSRSRSQYIGSPLNASYAEFFRFVLQFLCLKMCVHGGSTVPQGAGGGPSLGNHPAGGGGGPSSVGWGRTRAAAWLSSATARQLLP